ESFNETMLAYPPQRTGRYEFRVPGTENICQTMRLSADRSVYRPGERVGKSCAQVGRAAHDDAIVANDSEVFEKWSQAIASAADLADEAATRGQRNDTAISVVLPILVVPDGALWEVGFRVDGSRLFDPRNTERCPFYVGHEYLAGGRMQGKTITMSHLEIVTLTGLEKLLRDLAACQHPWFPTEKDFETEDSPEE